MKQFTSATQKKGLLGEVICSQHLLKSGFSVIERNYSNRFGEIDIIAYHNQVLYFIEVKTCFTYFNKSKGVSYETSNPLLNLHIKKKENLRKTVGIYLNKYCNVSYETYQCDAYAVFIDRINHDNFKIEYLPFAF